MNITSGKREIMPEQSIWTRASSQRDDARKLYDRLRKRSYRKLSSDSETPVEQWWEHEDHEAYIAGVRDALNEILNG